jgi:hypothetical protein
VPRASRHGNRRRCALSRRRSASTFPTRAPWRASWGSCGCQGDLDGAEEALARAYEFGLYPRPGTSLVQLARGDVGSAAASIDEALEDAGLDALARAPLRLARVEIALPGGNIGDLRAAARELTKRRRPSGPRRSPRTRRTQRVWPNSPAASPCRQPVYLRLPSDFGSTRKSRTRRLARASSSRTPTWQAGSATPASSNCEPLEPHRRLGARLDAERLQQRIAAVA